MMKNYIKIALFGILVTLFSCNKADQLSIKGIISGADGDTLTIKHLLNNKLVVADSKVLTKSGKFNLSMDVKTYPEFYFLQVNDGRQLVVIRDSSTTITVDAESANLSDATVTGSELSVRIQDLERIVAGLRSDYAAYLKAVETAGEDQVQALGDEFMAKYDAVKATIAQEIYKDLKSYYVYYALYQRLSAEHLLFSPYDEDDYKYFAGAATSYDLYHKEDPRTKALYKMVSGVIEERRQAAVKQMVKDAPSGLPDLVMNDVKGVERKLSDLKGKVVILNFWASKSNESRVLNQELLALYKKYKSRGLTVFQVSADKSKILWEEAIEHDNLPWTNVCDFKEGASQPFMLYNIKAVPTTFLLDREGGMVAKFSSVAELEKAIKNEL